MFLSASPLIQLIGWTSFCPGNWTPSISDLRSSSMTTHINKVRHVTAITKVAKDLGEDEDWLRDVANGMEIEDGAIWVINWRLWRYFVPTKPPGRSADSGQVLSGLSRVFKRVLRAFAVSTQRRTFGADLTLRAPS